MTKQDSTGHDMWECAPPPLAARSSSGSARSERAAVAAWRVACCRSRCSSSAPSTREAGAPRGGGSGWCGGNGRRGGVESVVCPVIPAHAALFVWLGEQHSADGGIQAAQGGTSPLTASLCPGMSHPDGRSATILPFERPWPPRIGRTAVPRPPLGGPISWATKRKGRPGWYIDILAIDSTILPAGVSGDTIRKAGHLLKAPSTPAPPPSQPRTPNESDYYRGRVLDDDAPHATREDEGIGGWGGAPRRGLRWNKPVPRAANEVIQKWVE